MCCCALWLCLHVPNEKHTMHEDSRLSSESQDGKQMLLNAPGWLASIVGIKRRTSGFSTSSWCHKNAIWLLDYDLR